MLPIQPTIKVQIFIKQLVDKFNKDHGPLYEVISTHSNYSNIGVQLTIEKDGKAIWATKNVKSLVDYAKKLEH